MGSGSRSKPSLAEGEQLDPAPYSEKAAPAQLALEGVSPGTVILPTPETTLSIQAVEFTTVQTNPSDTAQDTKLAVQPHATSTLGTEGAMETDTTIQRPPPHQATLSTQTAT